MAGLKPCKQPCKLLLIFDQNGSGATQTVGVNRSVRCTNAVYTQAACSRCTVTASDLALPCFQRRRSDYCPSGRLAAGFEPATCRPASGCDCSIQLSYASLFIHSNCMRCGRLFMPKLRSLPVNPVIRTASHSVEALPRNQKAARRPPCKSDRALSANHHNTKYSVIRLSGQLPIAFYTPNAQTILQGHL